MDNISINDILNLQHENERLDSYIKIIQNEFKRITDLPESKEYAYVTIKVVKDDLIEEDYE